MQRSLSGAPSCAELRISPARLGHLHSPCPLRATNRRLPFSLRPSFSACPRDCKRALHFGTGRRYSAFTTGEFPNQPNKTDCTLIEFDFPAHHLKTACQDAREGRTFLETTQIFLREAVANLQLAMQGTLRCLCPSDRRNALGIDRLTTARHVNSPRRTKPWREIRARRRHPAVL